MLHASQFYGNLCDNVRLGTEGLKMKLHFPSPFLTAMLAWSIAASYNGAQAFEMSTTVQEECASGDIPTCVSIAEATERQARASGSSEQLLEAMNLYAATCDLGHQESCTQAGRIYFELMAMQEEAVNERREAHLSSHRQRCESGDLSGCEEFASYFDTRSVSNRAARVEALEMRERACDEGHADSCRSLGDIYSGQITRRTGNFSTRRTARNDYVLSRQYYREGCALGDQQSCESQDMSFFSTADISNMNEEQRSSYIEAATLNCQEGRHRACNSLSALYAYSSFSDFSCSNSIEFALMSCRTGGRSCGNLLRSYFGLAQQTSLGWLGFSYSCHDEVHTLLEDGTAQRARSEFCTSENSVMTDVCDQ